MVVTPGPLALARKGDWQTALSAYIAECEGRPFAWGSHDCAMFAAGAVLAMTGTDIAAEFRGRYSTEAGSVRALKRYGHGTLEATLDAKLPAVPIGFARRGDLVMRDEAVGVAMGPFALFAGEAEGRPALVRVPRSEWRNAWSAG